MAGIVSAQSSGTPRTPWGEPDLQGTWSSEAELSVPFERPAQYGDRRFLTDAEFAQRQKQTASQLQSDSSEFDVFTADTRNAGAVGSATSPPPHWLERGKASRRTSLVIDPPDGRLPATRRRGAAAAAAPPPARSPVARSAAGRSPARGSEPVGALHHARRARRHLPDGLQRQHPHRAGSGRGRDHLRDDSRHARHSRSERPRTSGRPIRGYEGDSRGRWEGDTLVVDTDQLQRQDQLSRFRRDAASGRALHAATATACITR